MKYVEFEKVSIKNFLSVGKHPVEVEFKGGLHVITGINKDKQDRRNGVGKSTIADAIHFAIFGSTIRELKKDNIVNHLIGSKCEVVLEFSITENENVNKYKIVRMLEPSKCYLYVNGEDKTRDSISNTSDYICKLLQASQDIFQNSVIMTLNNTIPFMGKKKVEKRKFIEGIFNLEVFGQMLSTVRQDYNEVKRNFDIETGRFDEVEKAYEAYVAQKEKSKTDNKERYDKLVGRQDSNIKELKELRDKVFESDESDLQTIRDTIKSKQELLEAVEQKIISINQDNSTNSANIKHKEDERKKIGTDEETCPVCLKPVSDHDREHIHEKRESITTEIEKIEGEIGSNDINLEKLNVVKGQLKDATTSQNDLLNSHMVKIKENENVQKRISQLEEWNEQLEVDLKNVNTDNTQFDDMIKKCKQRLDELDQKINDIKHKLEILDVIKFVVSEEGVKSYIVRKILQLFNNKLLYYLEKMDANCCCIFNEYFEEEIVDEKGKMCSYYNFSGAERKNIDLACLFAFMDIRRLQGNVSYNISVYDELLDSSLDERGVDLVLNILRERVEKYNECVMIISHRKESTKIGSHYKNPGEVIFLEKENGITRRVEFTE